ncbi:TPA: type II secretion system protein GspE [Candidatus Nomurabacteria bacterium]|nr:type II secretion system protein GspE [Candidatus Nomurabacteria bacterium]
MLLLDLFVSQNKLTELEAKDIESDLSLRDDVLVDDVLVKKNIKGEDVTEVRSILYGLPIYKTEVPEGKELTKYISVTQSKQLLAIPLELKDDVLLVGVVDPEHGNVLDSLQFLFGTDHQAYKVYLITYDAYRKHFGLTPNDIEDKASLSSKIDDQILSYVTKDEEEKGQSDDIDLTDIDGGIDGDLAKLPVPDIFSIMLRYAIDNAASDIHIEHTGTALRARVRLDGQLETATSLPPRIHPMLIARVKILCQMKLDEKRKPQDGRFSTKFGDHNIDYRVSTFPGYYGEKVVIRILDSYKGVRPIDKLGFSEQMMREIRAALDRPYGMILICGPTGSGKTTTLYSMLNEIDREHLNVVSLEDPIEYNVGSMNQSQVFPEIGYTFASGLRSILRQDPDVIMVGEIRDAETAQLAIQAALTGHLVFSTIHTNTAIGVVTRLLDMGIEPYLIAPTLIATIGQRLSRQIAEGCGSKMEMNTGLTELVQKSFKDLPDEFKSKLPLDQPLYEAKPNATYANGTKGRVPVFEVLTFTGAIQEAVLHSKGEEEIWKLARADGMITMKEDAIVKCIAGRIPFIEINEL